MVLCLARFIVVLNSTALEQIYKAVGHREDNRQLQQGLFKTKNNRNISKFFFISFRLKKFKEQLSLYVVLLCLVRKMLQFRFVLNTITKVTISFRTGQKYHILSFLIETKLELSDDYRQNLASRSVSTEAAHPTFLNMILTP